MAGENLSATYRILSCHPCRQRKVGCDKVLPCQSCRLSGLACSFPAGRKHSSRAGNDELLRRIAKLEQLILQNGLDGEQPMALKSPASQELSSTTSGPSQQSERPSRDTEEINASEKFVGHSFLKSLASEINVMRDLAEGQSAKEDWDDLAATNSLRNSTHAGPKFYVSDTKNLRQLHPSAPQAWQLFTYYVSNVDPMFKLLHIPTLQSLVSEAFNDLDRVPVNDSSEGLLFAVYYGAISSLTEKECLATFENRKETLLAQYRAGLERALSNANFLRKPDLCSLQALAIFLVALRANENSQLPYTLLALAVRLARILGLHREQSSKTFSVLETELRRRLWWQVIVLDGRFATDIATDRFIPVTSFNTKKPLNINDSDIDLSTKMVTEREGLTEMTKCRLTHDILGMAWRLQSDDLPGQGAKTSDMANEKKMSMLAQLEQHVEKTVLGNFNPSNPIAWANSIIGHITIRRARLIVYYPLYNGQHQDRPMVSQTDLLTTAVECMEYCNLLDTDPVAARWRWMFNNAPVFWYGLSATLAELCVLTEGPMVDRAWAIVDLVYDDWSTRLAKSTDFKAWRPIGKLHKKAQARRSEALLGNIKTLVSEQAQLISTHDVTGSSIDFHVIGPVGDLDATPSSASRQEQLPIQTIDSETPKSSGVVAGDFDFNIPSSHMDWTEWDQFAHDLWMEG